MAIDAPPGEHIKPLLQELLLALIGYTGDVFVDEGDSTDIKNPNSVSFLLAKDVPCANASEREVLNSLVKLGFHCRSIDNYVKLQAASGDSNGSLYRKALARGLSEVLDVYKGAVLKLQHFLSHDDSPPLSSLQHYLHEFQVLLPALHHLAHDVHHRGLVGGQVLKLLHSKAHCGIPALQSCFRRVLWHCNLVLYRQLASWLVHGLLLDQQGGEFFVRRRAAAAMAAAPHAAAARSSSSSSNPAADPSSASNAEDGEEDGLGPNYNQHSLEWQNGFEVVPELVPPYISQATAATVMFIGKAVRVLQQPAAPQPSADLHFGRGGAHALPSAPQQQQRGLLPESDALEFANELHALQRRPVFPQLEFEVTAEWIKGRVAGHLMRLAVINADLPRHLAALRDYFLMAKGDFWQCFLIESKTLLALPPKLATAEADINLPFQQSAAKIGADHDPLFHNLRVTFKESTKPAVMASAKKGGAPMVTPRNLTVVTEVGIGGRPLYIPAYDKWDAVSLEYRLDWPLHLLLTAEVLSKYNVVFQYLLRLKRLQLSLEDAWATMRHFDARDMPHRRRMLKLWSLRHHMAHAMSNLQIYVQVDVVEAQHAKLQDAIGGARDYGEAEAAHTAFIDALVLQSFLDLKQIMSLLEAMMSLCHRLAAMVQQQTSTQGGNQFNDEAAEQKLDSISTDFWRRAKMLYLALQSNKLQGSNRAPYLRQFLLRLNFNGYMAAQVAQQQGQAKALDISASLAV